MYIWNPPAMLWFVNYGTFMPVTLGMWIKTINPGIEHEGIVTDVRLNPATNEWVIYVTHTTPERGVHESTLDDFRTGRHLALVAAPQSEEHRQMISATASVNLGHPYALFNKNCQHFCSHCYTHHAQSPTLAQGAVIASLVVATAVAIGASRD